MAQKQSLDLHGWSEIKLLFNIFTQSLALLSSNVLEAKLSAS